MLNFLKEWGVFSGIGVLVLGALGRLAYMRFSRSKSEPPIGTGPIALATAPTPSQFTKHVTPESIKEAIKSAPALSADNVAKSFIGVPVEWNVNLHSAETGNGDQVNLTFDTGFALPMVDCTVNLKSHPYLPVTKRGTKMFVQGTILEIGPHGLWIRLRDVTISKQAE